ncbi:hypothetical protein U0070_027207 [Myodes glareolus]|uniref:Secreted protein n=1 Tax=Myodes glareolus TaxID=447135 RepID=A0AAW0IA05_MYOGA
MFSTYSSLFLYYLLFAAEKAGTVDESVAEEGEGGKESEPAEQGGEERACVRMAYRVSETTYYCCWPSASSCLGPCARLFPKSNLFTTGPAGGSSG